MARPSASVNHTAPSPPVQQLPHWVHENLSPSRYQGSSRLVALTAYVSRAGAYSPSERESLSPESPSGGTPPSPAS